ncbi:1-(5-phosphoribosyl)-5-[(5-phosphoribosylamino)methylideneamino]imidazole-4-carboxamide isomerase [Petroclostridium sp. X23]|uniref:1-(5-phosphoribosyl)-5-[(5- phosphoribosylamino)methylideneamino]imidazole-4- carboxamide isomerase n=1 Tax=Petroclostridium sp. X23 TaxID=3045146 RepID=UPI0024AE433A|nr:1-(5-phosphoribosyl)-5-[(5-phosphoribosylamino)methylideneamino]imidazole-4-carboxamide isomerase [Petroclostridium sp. X23]WHH58909.1 1-(5-phosphoribosyl)-5-[(5-phosphoribosylamino)methylideneamino]imidazole-4-carboxamide isomerase [Petroclostridium sp. X23]
MILYPAIDIRQGKCVRLVQGSFSDMTVYSDHPVQMAQKWEQNGAEFIHLVDLDGALSGKSINSEVITEIAKTVNVPVQLGGGIRSMDTIQFYLDNGINRVILGTSAVKNPALVKEAVEKYGNRIVVGIDAKDGMAAVGGWEEVSAVTAVELALKMQDMGVQTIIYTDIAKDGMLQGPNVEAMKEMVDHLVIDVIASGGVSTLEDIVKLTGTGVQGAIIGKALYTGNIDLVDALRVAKE